MPGTPVWNAGSTYSMAAEAGAELTLMENRFVPTRFKDGYGGGGGGGSHEWYCLYDTESLYVISYMLRRVDCTVQ